MPQQADDDEARADLRLLDDDYVDPLACAVAGHRWTALELAAYGSYRYGCVRARVEQDYAQLPSQRFLCLRTGEDLGLRELRARLSGVYFLARLRPQQPRLTPQRFVDAWCRDARQKQALVDPALPPGWVGESFNRWPGLAAAALPPTPPDPAVLGAFTQHVREVLCAGEDAEWFLDHLAHIVQHPERPTRVAVLFSSLPGSNPQPLRHVRYACLWSPCCMLCAASCMCALLRIRRALRELGYRQEREREREPTTAGAGKNTALDFFRLRVLGERVTCQLDDPRRALFGRFATMHQPCTIMSQWDEATGLHGLREHIKNLVTAPTLVVRQKYRDDVVVTNYVNLFITTNEDLGAVALDAADRRFVCYRASAHRKHDAAYFDALYACLDQAHAARVVYDFLMARPPGRGGRPLTEFYKLCVRQSISPLGRFMSAVVHARAYRLRDEGLVRVGQLYSDYRQFCADGRLAQVTRPAFTASLSVLLPEMPKRVFAGGFAYILQYESLRRQLRAADEYDAEAVFEMHQPGPSAWEAQDVVRGR